MDPYPIHPTTTYPFAVNGLLGVSQIFMIFFGNKMSTRFKVQWQFIIAAGLVATLPFLTEYVDSKAAKYWAVFFILFVYGPVNGIVQGTVFGLASQLPPPYVGALMFGNGLSGLGTTLFSMLLVYLLPGDDNLYLNSIIFFGCATLVLLLSAAVYSFVMNSPFYLYHASQKKAQDGAANDEDERASQKNLLASQEQK